MPLHAEIKQEPVDSIEGILLAETNLGDFSLDFKTVLGVLGHIYHRTNNIFDGFCINKKFGVSINENKVIWVQPNHLYSLPKLSNGFCLNEYVLSLSCKPITMYYVNKLCH